MGTSYAGESPDQELINKEWFCRQLYEFDSFSDSDQDADDLSSLLRERRKQAMLNPSTMPRSSIQNSSSRHTQKAGSTTPQGVGPDATSGHASDASHMTGSTAMKVDQKKRLPNRLDKGTNGLRRSERQRKDSSSTIPEGRKILQGLVFFFIPNNDISPARRMRIKRSVEFGACRAVEWCENITHIIVDRGLAVEDIMKYLKMDTIPSNISLVNEAYPAECIANRAVLDVSLQRFRVDGSVMPPQSGSHSAQTDKAVPDSLKLKSPHGKPNEITPNESQDLQISSSIQFPPSNSIVGGSQGKPEEPTNALDELIGTVKASITLPVDLSDEEDIAVSPACSDSEKPGNPAKRRKSTANGPSWQRSFSCMQKHDGEMDNDNPNGKTIEILQQMLDYYEKIGDQWRCLAYGKAIGALRKEREKVATKAQALSIRGIGDRLASKIEEIVWTHRLRRLEYANLEPNDVLLSQFMKVYGAGFSQASKWIAQGYESLDDLKKKANLTTNQRVGLDHYEDFQQRIPRAEVQAHGDIVMKSVLKFDSEFQVIIGGSYRRGKSDSGDIDVIITKDGASLDQINRLVTDRVVPDLYEQDFLKAHLAVSSRVDGSKWHGASALPGNPVWRRIDLLFVPGDERGAALIYFTGNDVFNRSLRLLASKKGMCLNQKGLFADILRRPDRVKLNKGHLVEGRDEKRIFELLGVPWRPPHHRIC